MAKLRKPYCPRNGCFMPNGAAMAQPMNCPVCSKPMSNHDKTCPHCHHCPSCKRIGKRFYNLANGLVPYDPFDL